MNLPTEIQKANILSAAFLRMGNERGTDWTEGDGRMLFDVVNLIQSLLERCVDAALRSSVMELSVCVRNLFELTVISDYLSRSSANRIRFEGECALDTLEVMDSLRRIDERDPNNEANLIVQAKQRELEDKIAFLGLTGKRPRDTRLIARDIGREDDFSEIYKVYSKMSHPSAWAILGGRDVSTEWESLSLYLMLRANGYAAECFQHLFLTISTPT